MDPVSLAALASISANLAALYQKTKYVGIHNENKDFILQNGLYHFTSKEGFEAIQQDKFIQPSKLSFQKKPKTFLFSGIPSLSVLRENIAERADCFEFYAIKVMPTEEQLKDFSIRALDDKAVICDGCDLTTLKYQPTELVMDLDENKKLILREKTEEEKGKAYEPSDEVRKALKPMPKAPTILRNLVFTGMHNVVKRMIHNITHPKETMKLLNPPTDSEIELATGKEDAVYTEPTFDERYAVDLSKQSIPHEAQPIEPVTPKQKDTDEFTL